MPTSSSPSSKWVPQLILQRHAFMDYKRDDHGVYDYSNPTTHPCSPPKFYSPNGETEDMQGAYVFPQGVPAWFDNRTHTVVHIRLERADAIVRDQRKATA